MRNRKNILRLWLLLVGGLALSSCTKNEDTTVALIGEEYYIDDILSVVSDAAFWSDFGSINRGAIPPDVQGSYLVSPMQRVASNLAVWPLQVVEPNAFMRFSKQHNGIVVMDLNDATEQRTDTVFVMGKDNDFTVYFVEDKNYEVPLNGQNHHVNLQRGVVVCGTVTADGLSNFRVVFLVLKAESDAQDLAPDRGSYFIYKDGNGLAENYDW